MVNGDLAALSSYFSAYDIHDENSFSDSCGC